MSSTSEYHESERSMMDEEPPYSEAETRQQLQWGRSSRGRRVKKNNYKESASEDDFMAGVDDPAVSTNPDPLRRLTRARSRKESASEDDFMTGVDDPTVTTATDPPRRMTRARSRAIAKGDEVYVDRTSDESDDADGSLDDDAPHTSDLDADADAEGEPDLEAQDDGRPYALRQRVRINYAIPPPIEEAKPPPKSRPANRARAKRGPGWSVTGAELSRWMGMPADDSDSDIPGRTPRKGLGALMGAGAVGAGSAGLVPGDLAAVAGTPSNLGKIGDSALADADPLGVNQNVTFDEVGGLDEHVRSLKEMTMLPLLYPEVFQRFDITPPRGVLFHGPPGTGKTLLARALAASCRANGKGISFFMRKGADCLSKWVGEAERQLRLLFDEARNCQPSIIFFDEIDGLAPVRSSKQDQIHASIVSTLLALMDGMDGRGQVIVIGATNRPDAIDPALRRPGRFDREFYFPLPSLEARAKILGIMTKNWDGWSGDQGKENLNALAKLTKGYAGADLRALCTEAALNAIQRRYPQIYESSDRLLLRPETISVTLRDFMISVKGLVPSSARSSSSVASPLPPQLEPLLGTVLQKVKDAINKVLPVSRKRSALEEAQWEESSEQSALEREMLMQSMETLRVYRPRLVIHGQPGMGQGYIGAAALHHLEGYHIQSLDLAALMGDPTRTVEAAIVQLFVEVKRHQPSVIYIPSLLSWCAAVHETTRTAVRAMLDSLAPTDPILLLALIDGSFSSLPSDVRSWFGISRDNRFLLSSPSDDQRQAFFANIISDVQRRPNQFADGLGRKRRILEVLPIAPPPEPKEPTAAELAAQAENDQRLITLLKYRLGPVVTELKRKFKRFTKRATEEYEFVGLGLTEPQTVESPGVQLQAQTPAPLQPPHHLFDMDLERMHMDLYKGKYLTPQDFLDDIHKIVHNAAVRMHEDHERLHKAQAMLIAAEVSMQEFDAHFKLECQRMAEREEKRRMERKKHKDKAWTPGGTQNGAYAPGTRRSARHTGQRPEMTITDPLQLERRLKRARSGERPSGSGNSSEDDQLEGAGIRRLQPKKRPRTIVSDDDDQDTVDAVADSPKSGRNGFDPSLLNPLPPEQDPVRHVTVPLVSNGAAVGSSSHFPATPQRNGEAQASTETIPASLFLPQLEDSVPPPFGDDMLPIIYPSRALSKSPTPLPEFHADEGLLLTLQYQLKTRTSQLSVEQLEQLRANCLNHIWNHRMLWNRDSLLHELLGLLDEFLEDCVVGSDGDVVSPLNVVP